MKSFGKYALLMALFGAAGVEAQTTPKKSMPAGQMRLRADSVNEEIEADNRHVLHLQAIARKEKDVIKLTCINDKLVQIKAQMNLFDSATLQLDSADEALASAAFADIEQAAVDIKKLRGEADGCAGELEMYKQESKSDVSAPDLDDPTDDGPFHSPEQTGDSQIDVPGFATPWK